MSFDLDACLDEYSVPASKERAVTFTTQYPPSRMALTNIPAFESTEVTTQNILHIIISPIFLAKPQEKGSHMRAVRVEENAYSPARKTIFQFFFRFKLKQLDYSLSRFYRVILTIKRNNSRVLNLIVK